jgi:hypothetical protein
VQYLFHSKKVYEKKEHFTLEKEHFTWEKEHFTWEKEHFTWQAVSCSPDGERLPAFQKILTDYQ